MPNGALALTPHPQALGSALTHPLITTDYSESQLELITGAHLGVQDCLDGCSHPPIRVPRSMAAEGEEMMWAASMPCALPTDETIPLGRYGNSHIGRSKSIYRMGLGHRYGRRMQTISGIDANWSLPGVSSAEYLGLIRNFRRQAFLLLYLLAPRPPCAHASWKGATPPATPWARRQGAVPAACDITAHGPSGYQSEAQSSINASFNDLDQYANSLQEALTRPYPASAIGRAQPWWRLQPAGHHLAAN